MSTLEMPACFALLLVMANLALCLSADTVPPAHLMNLSSIETLAGGEISPRCGEAARSARPC